MDFGTRLKILRKEKDLSQENFAKQLGVSRSAVGNYETNQNMPTAEILNKMSEIFQCSIDYILCKTDIKNAEQQDDPLGLAKIGFNMKDYTPPTETQKEQIKVIIETILKDNKKNSGDK